MSPTPQLTHLKQLFGHDCDQIHQQLDKMMAAVDVVQTLFERAGGAKSSAARKRRSRIGVSREWTIYHYIILRGGGEIEH